MLESVCHGLPEMNPPKWPSPLEIRSTWIGALGFTIASMVVFGSWAFAGRWMNEQLGEIGAYSAWACMFVLIAGGTLSRLVAGRMPPAKFYGLFAVAFILYATGWTAAWFALRNRASEWIGSVVGTTLMAVVFLSAFSAWRKAIHVMVTLFLFHSLGYFVGGFLYATIGGRPGMLLWGLAYGLGFGAGIGRVLFLCLARHEKP
jgi:hypothetical protein